MKKILLGLFFFGEGWLENPFEDKSNPFLSGDQKIEWKKVEKISLICDSCGSTRPKWCTYKRCRQCCLITCFLLKSECKQSHKQKQKHEAQNKINKIQTLSENNSLVNLNASNKKQVNALAYIKSSIQNLNV